MDATSHADLDPQLRALYCKKSIEFRWMRQTLRFDVPVDVFSSFQIDRGTQLLLRRIAAAGPNWQRVLDLGCGYGPITVALAAAGMAQCVDAVDRDALAVAFTQQNACLNGLEETVHAWGAIAYEDIPTAAYDAIVSNLPAKAGPPVHRRALLGAYRHLVPGGQVWLVVVEPLQAAIDEVLADPAVAVHEKAARKEHVVYNYSFLAEPALAGDPYVRERADFQWKRHQYSMTVLHGLAEFDCRSWATGLLVDAVQRAAAGRRIGRLAVCNPGQGHAVVLACGMARDVDEVLLISRDRLALRASAANLAENGFRGAVRCVHSADFHADPPSGPIDLALAVLNEKETLAVNVEKLRRLASGPMAGPILAACKSSLASRLKPILKERALRITVLKKHKGFCAIRIDGPSRE